MFTQNVGFDIYEKVRLLCLPPFVPFVAAHAFPSRTFYRALKIFGGTASERCPGFETRHFASDVKVKLYRNILELGAIGTKTEDVTMASYTFIASGVQISRYDSLK